MGVRRRTETTQGDDGLVRALARVPAFAGCDRAGLLRIAALGTTMRCRPGAVLQRADRTFRQAMVVVAGTASDRPATGPARTLVPGDLVGAAALLDPAARAASRVVAETHVDVLVFGPAELGAVAEVVAAAGAAPAPVAVPRAVVRRPRPAMALPVGSGLPAPA